MMSMIMQELTGNYKRKDSNNTLCSTPTRISRFLGQLINIDSGDTRVLELGGGAGSISQFLPSGTLVFEKLQARIERGKIVASNAVWSPPTDCLTRRFMTNMARDGHFFSYDVVVSNPDFEVAMQFLYLGLQLLNFHNPQARLIFLLPSDFFEGSAARTRVYKILNLHVEMEYKLGHLGFYEHMRGMEKLSCDSLFVLRRGRKTKYEWKTINARLAGMLRVEGVERHRTRKATNK